MDGYNLVSLAGVVGLIVLAWALGGVRNKPNWRVIGWGVGLQALVAVVLFWLPASADVFAKVNVGVVALINAAAEGGKFLFGPLGAPPGTQGSVGFVLACQALPVIIVFAALMQCLYHLGVMQRVVQAFAWLFTRLMRISGAESLCTASNIFVGLESATAVRPYLLSMTRSELTLVLTAGMATVASSVLTLYVLMLQSVFPQIAGHLITASLLSAPAAIVMAKLIVPETETPETLGARAEAFHEPDADAFEALVNGAMAGLKMVAAVGALLIAFVGLVAMINVMLGTAGVSLQSLLAWVFWPLALLMGVPLDDAWRVAQLLGDRVVLTEVASYQHLAGIIQSGGFQQPRSVVIATYALCGFAHIASMAIFVGGVAALVPERRSDLARLGPRALLAATLACLMTGAIAGVFYHEGFVSLAPS